MTEGNIVKLFEVAKDELIKNFDWIVENQLLRNFTKHQISFGAPIGKISAFGVDIDLHIANSIKIEFYQSVMKTIIKELFKTDDYDFVDFSSEEIDSSFLLDMRHAIEIYEKILENNYKNLITNGGLGYILQDCSQFQVCPMRVSLNHSGVVYPIGKLGVYDVFIDPYTRFNDDRICLFDKVQINISNLYFNIIDESTFNPRYVLTYEMDFYINSVPKLLYVFTDKNSDNYKCVISKNRDIKIDKLLDDR